MVLPESKIRYLVTILMTPSVKLKDYKKFNVRNLVNAHITLDEIRYMLFKLSKSKYLSNRLVAEMRLKELQELFPIEQYPEKWI